MEKEKETLDSQLFVDYFLHGKHELQNKVWTNIKACSTLKTLEKDTAIDKECVESALVDQPLLSKYLMWLVVTNQPAVKRRLLTRIACPHARMRMQYFDSIAWPVIVQEHRRQGMQGQAQYDDQVVRTISIEEYRSRMTYHGLVEVAIDMAVALDTGQSLRLKNGFAGVAYRDTQRKANPMYSGIGEYTKSKNEPHTLLQR
jgi:hypothetical protein